MKVFYVYYIGITYGKLIILQLGSEFTIVNIKTKTNILNQ
jgi:hypothetical protein